MSDLSKTYSPEGIESKWYSRWIEAGCFRSQPNPNKKAFTVVIPPPNVTGVLHMGHMLNNTIQDVLVRRARMKGMEACWVPGTDHASIATEARVVKMLADQGIAKSDLSREEFLNHAFAWKDKYGGIILEQLKKLGASCDWNRTRFTMDPDMSEAVIEVFIALYKKGWIYRGVRMINWDPKAQTALSDEEVIYKEGPSRLFFVAYELSDNSGTITVATTRPETILGDTAICVHPEDERYHLLIGKKVKVPLINREIPIIADEYVDREFGTGALKITPAHDLNDYQIGLKHNLPVIDTIASDGTMSEAAGIFVGEDRFVVRKKITKALEEAGQLIKTEDIINKVGHSERTDAVIEPRLSVQWFVKMAEMAGPALEVVRSGQVKLHPAKFFNTYKHWMENVKDWCISRQLLWGQRIPAWYDETGDFVVAKTALQAIHEFDLKGKTVTADQIRQDEDVVDTWFSSWLWPITVFDPTAITKPREEWNEDLRYYYPTQDLVTAPEILFFWVARMIMAGTQFAGDIPFHNVYLTGIVRDKQGRKMSKSLGNSPDPLDLIAHYGADGVRMGMLLSSPAGNDLLFDESLCLQGRNFANKIWNAYRLVSGWNVEPGLATSNPAATWFEARFQKAIAELEDCFEKYRLSEAITLVYKLVWDDFCSCYLEMIKPEFGQGIASTLLNQTIEFFDKILRLLHPFMPFITEELWQTLPIKREAEFLCLATWPEFKASDLTIIQQGQRFQDILASIRNLRNQKQLSPKEELEINLSQTESLGDFEPVLKRMATVRFTQEDPSTMMAIIVGKDKLFVNLQGKVDSEEEKRKLNEEKKYLIGFLQSVQAKLSNERFVQNAKIEIVENERNKEKDALEKLALIEETLRKL